ncbi:hypothetical protein QVD17_37383 [Tagetes erecta]|uniref:Uncharacterized protein n=1 Tax=Tagetes erecta TaxID=13708 RepID=A0AAD8JUH9_TARER|nr:hypothetical protein QVD17_37383 [Tagetes erecta]
MFSYSLSLFTNMKLFLAYLLVFIFLSLIEASPIFPKYAKTGCRDKCGNVRIPYPFGIGADCSINQWYIIDCSSSKPYLRELSHLEVLGIDLKNITVTVNMPKISNCQNPFKNSTQIMSIDLEGTPFLFSKEHNKFVLEGCGFASLVNNTSVVTACSTTCLSVTVSDRNNCFENGCCQTTIPSYLKSYTINLGLERQREDGGCDAAFLVDESLYDQGRVTNPLNVMGNASFIPVSLTWTLTKSDIVTCCNKRAPVQRILGVLNSIRVDTWICIYNTYSFDWNPYLTDECITEQATPKYAIKRCKYNCGNNVTIAYPFGIGADCSINRWYIVDCISFKPHLRALNHLEVLGVSWQNQTVIVRTPRNITDCKNSVRNSSEIKGVDLGRSPFFLSKGYNKFVFKGCGAAAMMDNGSVLAGCSTTCPSLTHSDSNNCNGIGCCQIAIPSYLKSYNINITRLEEEDGGCGSAFLVDIMSYENPSFSDPVSVKSNTSFIPISLTWTLTDSDEVSCCYGDTPYGIRIGEMFNGTPVVTWICFGYSSSDANPYVIDGCTSNTGQGTEECRMCTDSGGYCTWDVLYSLDNTIFSRNFICKFQKRTSWGIILERGILREEGVVVTRRRRGDGCVARGRGWELVVELVV